MWKHDGAHGGLSVGFSGRGRCARVIKSEQLRIHTYVHTSRHTNTRTEEARLYPFETEMVVLGSGQIVGLGVLRVLMGLRGVLGNVFLGFLVLMALERSRDLVDSTMVI